MQTFIEINDKPTPTDFFEIVKGICHKNQWVAFDINPIGRKHIEDVLDSEKLYTWSKRLKNCLDQFHPRERQINKMSPEKFIHSNGC